MAVTVAIIGAGFSGTALAANLLRSGRKVRVVLVNRFGPMGRGVAYGTRLEAHLLNVPAGQMSAYPDDPDHFLRHAQERDAELTPASFVSRRLYGEYLEQVLEAAERGAATGARLERVVGTVQGIQLLPDRSGGEITFTDSPPMCAERIVLALGNYSPADPPAPNREFYASERYVRDPWVRGALDRIEPGESVLLIGAGLTMMDIALDLLERGVRLPLRAVSRHGLLPHSHVPASSRSSADPRPGGIESPPATIAGYLRVVRAQIVAHEARGGDWRDVIGSLRGITPQLWRALPLGERARFLRHVRPYWDVHRHRAAPATAAAVAGAIDSGALIVQAGRILGYTAVSNGVAVEIRPRGSARSEHFDVARVVNCTGPDSDVSRLRDPLIRSLREQGLIRRDALGLGLDTGDTGAVIDADGRPSGILFLVGPLLKARYWESTAVPELRVHAAALASWLLRADHRGV